MSGMEVSKRSMDARQVEGDGSRTIDAIAQKLIGEVGHRGGLAGENTVS